MKALFSLAFLMLTLASCGQKPAAKKAAPVTNNKSLLWRISGKGLEKPSYLFGTIHIICKEDAGLSDSLEAAIKGSDAVYLELDMDNLLEMVGAMKLMKMKNDTTFTDLFSPEELAKVEKYFTQEGSLIPFSMLKTYKPFIAASTIMQSKTPCEKSTAMETEIMEFAKEQKKEIRGLETMKYQMSIFDTIPYKVQAQELLKYIDTSAGKDDGEKMFSEMMQRYREQDLDQLEKLINQEEVGVVSFKDILLYNRNRNWAAKLKEILPGHSYLFAVGAGHLPGENGVIRLLQKAGYAVTPVLHQVKKTI